MNNDSRRTTHDLDPALASCRVPDESFLWALHIMCHARQLPFDATIVAQQCPPPHTLASLMAASADLGLTATVRPFALAELGSAGTPFFMILLPPDVAASSAGEVGPAEPTPVEPMCRLIYVLRFEKERVTWIAPDRPEPIQTPANELGPGFSGRIVQFGSEPPAPGDDRGTTAPAKAFGFRWFVPELLKHRNIWRDVLGASLGVQLLALTIPLFTQVVIDKVIVHQATNTLAVIGIALVAVTFFSAAMSWVRQYLVLHTGNRIDAVLGTQVLEHLLRLPLPYFDHRPTGTIVARLQGVETIREFLSGAAITLLLDIPFLVVFLAIMFYYSWILTLIALGVLVLLAITSILVTPVLRARLNEQFLLGARNQAFMTEYVSGMETVKSLQMEPQLLAKYGDYLADYLNAGFNTRQLANSYHVLATMLEQILTVAVLCVGAMLVMQSPGFTIGMLVAFQMFAGRLSQPVLRLVGLWQELQQTLIAVKRLGDIMNVPREPYVLVPSREVRAQGRIELRNLSFRYGKV